MKYLGDLPDGEFPVAKYANNIFQVHPVPGRRMLRPLICVKRLISTREGTATKSAALEKLQVDKMRWESGCLYRNYGKISLSYMYYPAVRAWITRTLSKKTRKTSSR